MVDNVYFPLPWKERVWPFSAAKDRNLVTRIIGEENSVFFFFVFHTGGLQATFPQFWTR